MQSPHVRVSEAASDTIVLAAAHNSVPRCATDLLGVYRRGRAGEGDLGEWVFVRCGTTPADALDTNGIGTYLLHYDHTPDKRRWRILPCDADRADDGKLVLPPGWESRTPRLLLRHSACDILPPIVDVDVVTSKDMPRRSLLDDSRGAVRPPVEPSASSAPTARLAVRRLSDVEPLAWVEDDEGEATWCAKSVARLHRLIGVVPIAELAVSFDVPPHLTFVSTGLETVSPCPPGMKGVFELSAHHCNGREAYEQPASGMRLWWYNGAWRLGTRDQLGGRECAFVSSTLCASVAVVPCKRPGEGPQAPAAASYDGEAWDPSKVEVPGLIESDSVRLEQKRRLQFDCPVEGMLGWYEMQSTVRRTDREASRDAWYMRAPVPRRPERLTRPLHEALSKAVAAVAKSSDSDRKNEKRAEAVREQFATVVDTVTLQERRRTEELALGTAERLVAHTKRKRAAESEERKYWREQVKRGEEETARLRSELERVTAEHKKAVDTLERESRATVPASAADIPPDMDAVALLRRKERLDAANSLLTVRLGDVVGASSSVCAVCMEEKCDRVLQCGHMLCAGCVDAIQRRAQQENDPSKCPQCRAIFRDGGRQVFLP